MTQFLISSCMASKIFVISCYLIKNSPKMAMQDDQNLSHWCNY